MEDDDFLEQFRKKDFSKAKKFDFKKVKAINKSSEKSFSTLTTTNTSTKFTFKKTSIGFNEIEENTSKQHTSYKPLLTQKLTITPNNNSKIGFPPINNILNDFLPNSNKKCTLRKENYKIQSPCIEDNVLDILKTSQKHNSYKEDNILDSLYKSTTTESLQKKADSNNGSPSLLSGKSKITSKNTSSLSKYFNCCKPKDSGSPSQLNGLTPLKKLLQSKEVVSKSSSEIDLTSASSNNDSPIKPKKFMFKKNPLSSSSGGDEKLNVIVNECKNQVTTSTKVNENVEDNCFNKIHCVESSVEERKHANQDKIALNNQSFSSTSLGITDGDFMDDEEFERKFGSLADQCDDSLLNNINIPSASIKANTSIPENNLEGHKETEELLNEISNINWDEEFDEEPMPTGFKDRNDDSEEFRGQYDHSEVMLEVLHQKFGLVNFRPHQREIINASLTQHDCFVLMPTGGGKSLCYQLPAILVPGVTVVISPLRALISDQVDKLNNLDIAAAHLCSDVSKTDSEQIYMKLSMREPAIKLLYLTPEKINASRIIIDVLQNLFQRGKLARFVIDEVHCLSQWGHDFRPDYKELSKLRKNYKDVPIICLTATATKQVENDVINILHLKNVKKFITSFNRPNIKYQVIDKKGNVTEHIASLIQTKFAKKSGIVYCLGRKDCDNLAHSLIKLGVKAKPYHAGMTDKVREAVQREWMQDRFHVIVATIAFGMGIDKPDVRFVIHNSIPKSVEAFYQESGRAGRDGEISHSYLFYHYGDVGRLQRLIQMDRKNNKKTLEAHNENLKQMVSFAENMVDCRRYLLLIHLGEHFDRRICISNKSTICDNCENIDKYKALEVTKEAKELCAIVKDISAKQNVTLLHVADVYRGAKIKKILERRHNQHPFYGAGATMDRNDVQRVLKELILKHILQDFCTYTGDFPVIYIKPGPKFYQFYNSDYRLTISVCNDKKRNKKNEQTNSSPNSNKATTSKEVVRHTVQKANTAKLQAVRKLQLAQLKVSCHEDLLEECRRLAMERNLTLSSVINLTALKTMSEVLPRTKDEMLKVQHVTVANYNKYGEFFLKITQKFREQHDAIQPLTELQKPAISEKDKIQSISDEEEDDFYQTNSCSQSHGVKRKSSGNSWKSKKSSFKKRKVANKKKKKSPTSKRKTVCSGWKSKYENSGTRGGGGGGGGGLGIMPMHIK